jgi:citrate synthase
MNPKASLRKYSGRMDAARDTFRKLSRLFGFGRRSSKKYDPRVNGPKEIARRLRQIETGVLGPSSRGIA